MDIIKPALFKNIEFRATQDQIARLQQVDFGSFGRFVKDITFTPSPFSNAVTFEQFEDLMLVYQVHLTETSEPFEDGIYGPGEAVFWAKVRMREWWGGHFPKEDREVKALFRNHRDSALENERVLLNGELEKLWISALTTIQGIHRINISTVKNCLPHTAGGEIPIECQDYICFYRRTTVRSSEPLLPAVIRCLVASSTRPGQLFIDCSITSSFEKDSQSPEWASLDLGQTKTIHIEYPGCDEESSMSKRALHVAFWESSKFTRKDRYCEYMGI
jgi:hypothetical protein